MDYNFSKLEDYLGEWRGLGLMVRAKNFDVAVKEFINNHPSATIVNIGAGLDSHLRFKYIIGIQFGQE